ncbi:hypothetical protein [Thiohalomonas denitrificans]|uniref:Uncharacterized protein n=1 Tax=Thiohalomonas denitrificans TaxID=415747 RepID=A0A1G5PZC6_9GAMM|nr:hypothetical protein [Thiohalomonas denitrificans]SCZ54439.1 hypothetical protein SAMN03097708_00970 [Thiohalomonas denitrificans]
MSEKKRNNPLISELDSLKGLLEAGESDFSAAIDDLRMSACKTEDRSDEDDLFEDFIPEEYLVEVAQESLPDSERKDRVASFPSSFTSEVPGTGSTDADESIPTLEEVVEEERDDAEVPVPQGLAGHDGMEIPVLEETVSVEDIRLEAPDALGATSWKELEAIVDLLVERRLSDMREILKQELLGELERHTGLEPPTR